MKDLEVMMVNVINTAFDTVTTVEQGVELLDVFMHLSSREAIKRTLDKKTIQVRIPFHTIPYHIVSKMLIIETRNH